MNRGHGCESCGVTFDVVLQKGAALLALALVAGCGSSMSADKPEPIERHLVYEKIVGERGIWIAGADGSNPKLLVAEGEYHEISFPQISPDGTQVAYVGDCGSSHCTNA